MQTHEASETDLRGCWRVKSIDMIEGQAVTLIAGLPGEFVEFTGDGRYKVDLTDPRPAWYGYRVDLSGELPKLDVWIPGVKALISHCVYRISGDELTVCIAGKRDEHPAELRRDDQKLWCVKIFERAEPPAKQKKSRRAKPLLKPGSLIPEAFLDKGEAEEF